MKKTSNIRAHAEEQYGKELTALKKEKSTPKPDNWVLSPQQVSTYILGGKAKDGTEIEPKYFGQKRLVELAIATLITDRALLLIGVPGTAKTWLSEHLAAAISGDSTQLIQGTSGTGEDAIRYGWNYAKLLQDGPSEEALVPSPIMRAMQAGRIARIEELTRIPSDVQDALITVLSEKILPVAELGVEIRAQAGFNIIATANDRDKGIHELSSALQRRFNTVKLPLPASLEEELDIVSYRVQKLSKLKKGKGTKIGLEEIKKLITVFRELRSGRSEDGEIKLKSPSSTLSTAEAISAIHSTQSMAYYFEHRADDPLPMAEHLVGAVVKDARQDLKIFEEYLETVVKKRKGWERLYEACKSLVNAS
ncbi:MAG: AAA family ATPase [Saprospiraceae bacterium]|nr:AAA family ATPase [Saprospiraceae bacterium]